MLFCQQRSDETDDRWAGGEDPHDVGAASDLFVQSFLGVVGLDLPPVGFGEPGEDQDLCCGTVEVLRGVAETDLVEVVCDAAVLGPYLVGVGLSEDGTHHGGHHRFRRFGDLGQQVCAGSGCGIVATTPQRG